MQGGTVGFPSSGRAADISIHPPRAGRDPEMRVCKRCGMISIHPPRAGRDVEDVLSLTPEQIFHSTRPVRGGTCI